MARASTVAWLGITVGLALQPSSLKAQAPTQIKDPSEIAAVQTASPSAIHVAYRTAMDCYRRGDYELAASLLQQVQAGSSSLSEAERKDLASWQQLNSTALSARRDGASRLQKVEQALEQGKSQEALAALKAITPSQQFLSQADKLRVQQLSEQLMPGTPSQPSQNANAVVQARTKLKQARGLMQRGNYDAATSLVKEAELLPASYAPGEDTPQKLSAEIAKAKGQMLVIPADAKECLTAAKDALAKGQLDNAEILAREAEKKTSTWSMSGIWGDSPAKVLKEIDAARTAQASLKAAPITTPPVAQAVDASAVKASDVNDRARNLLKDARRAMGQGNLPLARQFVGQAQAMKPQLDWREDTPEKLLAEMRTLEKTGKPTGSEENRGDARVMLRQAKELLSAGKLDEADKMAHQAAMAGRTVRWGFFEETPDKVQNEIRKAKGKRDQEESAKALADAKKALEQGKLDEAEQLAHKAERLHGPYSIIEMTNSPRKLLTDIDAARAKAPRGKQQPATAVAQEDKPVVTEATPVVAQKTTPMPSTPAVTAQAPVPQNITKSVPFVLPTTTANQTPMVPVLPVPAVTAADNIRMQALGMMAEARQLQSSGKLVEARMKALECQKLSVSWGPNDDRPEMLLIAASAMAQKRIEVHMQQAADCMAGIQADPTKAKIAEQELQSARQMAASFGLDTGSIDGKLMQVAQAQGKSWSDPSPAGRARVTSNNQPTMPAFGAPAANQGASLLEKARMELRAGQTATARRLAEEAYQPQFAVQAEASQVLRSIDAEEYNQKVLTATRTFDAAMSAYNRKEYGQASLMLQTIDPTMLPAEKQAQLKEVALTASMQPSNIAQTAMKQAPTSQEAPGRVSVTDLQPAPLGQQKPTTNDAGGFAAQVKAMQEVKFQQLRADGLRIQSDATKKFDSGETDRALEMLQDYVAGLGEANLDSDKVALLKRPIEARMQTMRTVKHQRDFERAQASDKEAAQQTRMRLMLAEDAKKKQMAELMKQYQTFFKEGKYKEAEAFAMRAQELDPGDPVSSAAIFTARMQANSQAYKTIKNNKQEMVVGSLDNAENVGPRVDSDKPVSFDPSTTRNGRDRKALDYLGVTHLRTAKDREILRKLDAPISGIDYKETPMKQVLEDLGSWHGINIVPDEPALQEAGISLDKPVSMKLEGVSLKSALNLLLNQAHLTYHIKDEVLNVTTEDRARGKLEIRVHPVLDLVMPVENSASIGGSNVLRAMQDGTLGSGNVQMQSGGAPWLSPNSLPGGQATGTLQNNMKPQQGGSQLNVSKEMPKGTLEEVLRTLITNTIAPQSWSTVGGAGTIDYFPLGSALVINQTPDIQEQVADLLTALRRLQDMEVSVEVRFITIAENFYERIGLDFNLNLLTNNTKYQPQIVSQQFAPFGFINSFRPSKFISGLTPGGTFTQDLNIPIKASSFEMAVPPFGQYPNLPGGNGGLDLGLAFLSDIQVFLFLEAAQGDQRTNIMQAPKLTMFNGQTSTITVSEFQFFVTSVTVVQSGGQVVFVPSNTPIPTGVSLTMNSVISADRRFVRMSLTPTLTNLASANVPLFPITTFITPVFEGGAVGQPVPFTQFLQQPTLSTVSIQTTVNVPDGGTVLLGGLKRLSEGRNEFGPPILSKLPYINRLFKNVGYGREAESLMIMVTPRIIINEEEELRQVPTAAAGIGQ